MDDFLNQVRAVADIAEGREAPYYDARAIMFSVSGLAPGPASERYRIGFLAALTASAAAASIMTISYASAAWVELRNPFLALDSLTNALGWLQP